LAALVTDSVLAIANGEGALDKEVTSYKNLMDVFRLSVIF
jgi:hypothetical protein